MLKYNARSVKANGKHDVEERFLMDDEFLSKENGMRLPLIRCLLENLKAESYSTFLKNIMFGLNKKVGLPESLGDYMQTVYEVKINQ